MANYITAAQFTEITGVTAGQCGETGTGTTIRDKAITRAQAETLKDLDIKAFTGSETDYDTVQTAIAFLAAHKISIKNYPLSMTGPITSPFKQEYKDQIKLMKTTQIGTREPVLPSDGGYDIVGADDID